MILVTLASASNCSTDPLSFFLGPVNGIYHTLTTVWLIMKGFALKKMIWNRNAFPLSFYNLEPVQLCTNHFHPALSTHPFSITAYLALIPRCRALSCRGAGDGHRSALRVKAEVKPQAGCQLGLAYLAFTQLTLKWTFMWKKVVCETQLIPLNSNPQSQSMLLSRVGKLGLSASKSLYISFFLILLDQNVINWQNKANCFFFCSLKTQGNAEKLKYFFSPPGLTLT